MVKQNFSIIAAIANNWAIGKNNGLLIRIKEDMQWFKFHTLGNTVVMGRRTFESLNNTPLPKRRNIVLTNQKSFFANGVEIAHSIEQVFDLTRNDKKVFVIGGAMIYNLFLDYVFEMYITRIYSDFPDADTFFPFVNFDEWKVVFHQINLKKHGYPCDFDFFIYKRYEH